MTKVFLLAASVACFAFPVMAQQNCGPHGAVVAGLAERYGETRQAVAVGSGGALVEIFASETGSWTVVVTQPNGLACLVADGQEFELVNEELPGEAL